MLQAFVARGCRRGTPLYPHRHADGKLVVSRDRFKRNYIRVDSVEEAEAYLAQGLSMRMSNPQAGVPAASLIAPGSIRGRHGEL